MIALPPNGSPWLTAPDRVRYLPSPRQRTAAVFVRSVGLVAMTTAVGFALMGAAPRADQTQAVEAAVERTVVKAALRLADPAPVRIREPGVGNPFSAASLFGATPSAQPAMFSPAPLAGPPPDSFEPRVPDLAREWKAEEFPSVAVVDGRTLLAGTLRIRLVGLDLPMPEQVCRTLDGRLEHCTARAATQLELLTRWRPVTCHYRLENAEEAIGRCRIGTSDLTERMVKTGYAWRSAPSA